MTSTFRRITNATSPAVSGKQAKTSQRRFVIMWLGAILSLTTLAYAQSPDASVTGQVADSSKAILAGAHIFAVNVSTNIRYEATTNSAGEYNFPNLLPGTYRMEAQMAGFKAVIKPNVVLHVQDAAEINFELAIGSASESVTVDEQPAVRTQSRRSTGQSQRKRHQSGGRRPGSRSDSGRTSGAGKRRWPYAVQRRCRGRHELPMDVLSTLR
jgi:hypothetical protein